MYYFFYLVSPFASLILFSSFTSSWWYVCHVASWWSEWCSFQTSRQAPCEVRTEGNAGVFAGHVVGLWNWVTCCIIIKYLFCLIATAMKEMKELYHLSQKNSVLIIAHFPHIDLNCRFTLAYVTYEDICQVAAFRDQTVIAIKAPEETKLEVPTPTEVNFFT